VRWLGAAAVTALLSLTVSAEAQEYRGYWVDTFNTPLNTHADVLAVVSQARLSNANALFAQVRRRGDAWFLNSVEPAPDFVPIEAGFDPLQDLIAEAHGAGLQVHAFVIMGAIWNRHPFILGPPTSPAHVFNTHGGYDPVTRTIAQGPDNWLTRTLLPDGAAGISFQGHRFGSDFWIDFGHPDAEAYTVEVLMHLVRNYNIDGLHLDRIRYPEISIAGQTPTTGANIGYNSTSLARFQRRYNIDASAPPPAPGRADWSQWRRDQVTNVVRRVYLEAIAIRPALIVSGAFIVFGGGPTTEGLWSSAEAYWRVYQDWRAWTEEGMIDVAIPMNYKRDQVAAQLTQYDQWLEWTRNHQYGRMALVGQGAFLNSIEATLRQVRRSSVPSSATGARLGGVVFFSMATSNVFSSNNGTTPAANPFSILPGLLTPTRSFAEFASGLTTGKSTSATTLFESPDTNPVPVFATAVPVPVLPWKVSPTAGHLKGFARGETGAILDTVTASIAREEDGANPAGRTAWTTKTDGGGFYGAVDLAPGKYHVTLTPPGEAPFVSCPTVIAPGAVTHFDVTIDRGLPATSLTADPSEIWPPNGNDVVVTVSGVSTDAGTGVASIAFRVVDEYDQVQPSIPQVVASGEAELRWERQVTLQASRRGDDRDGRTYTILATVTDGACNSHERRTTVTVLHDRRDK
jgi:uncharacterized lipoprotein YddW (UPF0748 family)